VRGPIDRARADKKNKRADALLLILEICDHPHHELINLLVCEFDVVLLGEILNKKGAVLVREPKSRNLIEAVGDDFLHGVDHWCILP
jgi:hypothetical protein